MPNFLERYADQVMAGLDIDGGADPLAHCALGLCGEAGEVADLIKKSQYRNAPKLDDDRLHEELGDELWYLTALARLRKTTIEQLAIGNIVKLEVRRGSPYSVSALIGRQADRS